MHNILECNMGDVKLTEASHRNKTKSCYCLIQYLAVASAQCTCPNKTFPIAITGPKTHSMPVMVFPKLAVPQATKSKNKISKALLCFPYGPGEENSSAESKMPQFQKLCIWAFWFVCLAKSRSAFVLPFTWQRISSNISLSIALSYISTLTLILILQ